MPLSKERDKKRKWLAKLRLELAGFTRISSCEVCNWEGVVDVHHKDSNRQNGDLANLQVLCPSCHRDAHRVGFQPNKATIDKPLLDGAGEAVPVYW